MLEFIVTLNDDDAGDQTGTGGPVDEDVGGTTTLYSKFTSCQIMQVQCSIRP